MSRTSPRARLESYHTHRLCLQLNGRGGERRGEWVGEGRMRREREREGEGEGGREGV